MRHKHHSMTSLSLTVQWSPPHEFFANYYRDISDPIYWDQVAVITIQDDIPFERAFSRTEKNSREIDSVFNFLETVSAHVSNKRLDSVARTAPDIAFLSLFWQIDSEKCESSSFHNKSFRWSGKASINLTTSSISRSLIHVHHSLAR